MSQKASSWAGWRRKTAASRASSSCQDTELYFGEALLVASAHHPGAPHGADGKPLTFSSPL